VDSNLLLRKLTAIERAAFMQAAERVELAKGQVLFEPETEIDAVYFPLTAVCSVIAGAQSDSPIEVGMFGNEGMSNMLVRQGDLTFFKTIVFVEGEALRIGSADFTSLLKTHAAFMELTLRYKDFCAVQFGNSAHANGAFTIEARLARWILMALDRLQGANLPTVHHLVASLLSVRRSGITTALHVLEGAGAIKATRGLITVRSREKLLQQAGDSYGAAERAYSIIMGHQPDQS
jgi:CRP-like cAMP-binding protein